MQHIPVKNRLRIERTTLFSLLPTRLFNKCIQLYSIKGRVDVSARSLIALLLLFERLIAARLLYDEQ